MRRDVLIWVLIGLLVLAVGYIAWDKYVENRDAWELVIYQQGASAGYEQAILDVASIAVTCEAVPLSVGENQTVEMIATACLQ